MKVLPYLLIVFVAACGASPKSETAPAAAPGSGNCPCPAAASPTANALRNIDSQNDVAETVRRIEEEITSKGLTHFSTIDHAANAARAGLELPPTRVIVFGNPKVGTQFMSAQPTMGLNLPMKILVYQDAQGVHIAYEAARSLAQRHALQGHEELLGKVDGVLAHLAEYGARNDKVAPADATR